MLAGRGQPLSYRNALLPKGDPMSHQGSPSGKADTLLEKLLHGSGTWVRAWGPSIYRSAGYTRSKVEYLPMINQNASDPSIVLSALLLAEKN